MRKFVKKAALVLPFLALAARPSEAVVLRYKFQPGERLNYVAKVKVTGQTTTVSEPTAEPISFSETALITYEVLALNQDGSYTLRMVTQPKESKIEEGQKAQLTPEPTVVRFVMTPLGEVKKVEVEGAQGQKPRAVAPETIEGVDPGLFMTGVIGFLLFPEGDVQVGQVWTRTAKVGGPPLQQPQQFTIKSELVQLTTYMDRPCAVIDTTLDMPMDFSKKEGGVELTLSGRTTGTHRTFFDHEAGRPLQLKGQFKMDSTFQFRFPLLELDHSSRAQMVWQFEATLIEGA